MGNSQKIPKNLISPIEAKKKFENFWAKIDRYLGKSVLHRMLRKS